MFVLSRFGPQFQSLDSFLLLIGLVTACGLAWRTGRDGARGLSVVMAIAALGMVWRLGAAWVALEHGRLPILLAPIAVLLGMRGSRRLTAGRNGAAIGGALVALLLLLGAAGPIVRRATGSESEEDIALAGSKDGLYDAAIVQNDEETAVVLRPRRLLPSTLLDFPQRTVYAPGFGTDATSIYWDAPDSLVVEVNGSGEIEPPEPGPNGLAINASRSVPGAIPRGPRRRHRRDSIERPDPRPMAEP